MRKLTAFLIALAVLAIHSGAAQVRFSPRDSVLAESIMKKLAAEDNPRSGELLEMAARQLLGTPYVAGTLDQTRTEQLTVSLTRTDCILFVETCFDMVLAAQEGRTHWRDLCDKILQSRYRNGVASSYADRIHYTTEWIRKGESRGLVEDLTMLLDGVPYDNHPINYMSTHPDRYPLLKDVGAIREVEKNLNRTPISYIPKSDIRSLEMEFMPGDIVCFVTSVAGLDISHVGIVTIAGGKVGFIHASSTAGKVVIDTRSIAEYAAAQRSCVGIKLVRMNGAPYADRYTFQYDGREREYWLYLPPGGRKNMPLVMVLHGYGGKADGYCPQMMFVAREEGFAVCYPQGRPNSVGKTGWNVGYPSQKDLRDDDVALVTALARQLQQEFELSPENTFLTGMSNGGEMCYLLAYSDDPTFSALASVAGLTMKWLYDGPGGTRPVPFMEIHGTADKTSRWEGDHEGQYGWGGYMGVQEAIDAMVRQNGCTRCEDEALPRRSADANAVVLHKYSGGSAEVRLYEVKGGKHSWAKGDMDTCREIWNFFKAHLASPDTAPGSRKISVMGSSVPSGTGATGKNGYVHLFRDNALTKGWTVSNISVPGDNTPKLLARYGDLVADGGRYVVYALSLGNEGIHNAPDPDAVYYQWRTNMRTLIDKARAEGKTVVVTGNYGRGDFNDRDYAYVKAMNLEIQQWDVPSVNLLGAVDDEAGHWMKGYEGDPWHPNDAGHAEMSHTIVPSLFDALAAGKPQPVRYSGGSLDLDGDKAIQWTPEATLHPFTVSFYVKTTADGSLLTLDGPGATLVISGGKLSFGGFTGSTAISDGKWHLVTLTHYYAKGVTNIYADSHLEGSVPGKMEVKRFRLGGATFRELFFWRSAMNAEEIAAVAEGKMLKSSLEIYVPMYGLTLANRAQSTNTVNML